MFAGVAAWSLARRERGWRSDAGRVALATLGGGGIVGGGLLAMAIGPARLASTRRRTASSAGRA